MWEAIQQLCPLAQPTHMLMDFEKAAINSCERLFLSPNPKYL